jgi:hypothetical protein
MNLLRHHKDSSLIYLINYGLMRKFQDSQGSHIPFSTKQPFIGTTTFALIHTHMGHSPSRHNDMVSLSYVFCYLLHGSLPWQHLKDKSLEVTNELISKHKQAYNPESLFCNCPVEFIDFYNYAQNLGFCDQPDYNQFHTHFNALLQKGKCFVQCTLFIDP